jgi:hypothetical protein
MIANYLSFFKLVGLIYKVEYGSSCLILPKNRTMKYILLAKNWSNSELKKLCKITAYDARGGEEDGSGTTPGGGSDNTQGGGTTGGTGSEGSGGTGSEGSGGNTSQGGGTGDGTGSNGDNEHITL